MLASTGARSLRSIAMLDGGSFMMAVIIQLYFACSGAATIVFLASGWARRRRVGS